tara:strand:+ start:114 stop:296 length:183 start_codon:yes stop_codon:yes gene_type:complete
MKIDKTELLYWADGKIKPDWLCDVLMEIINEEKDRKKMEQLKTEIKVAYNDSKIARGKYE